MTPIFAVHDLSHTYSSANGQQVPALRDINLEVQQGEFLAVVGPSGCGKSTLLDVLAGLLTPSSGGVFLDGERMTSPKRDVGVVFQQDSSFPWLSNRKNVEFGVRHAGRPGAPVREQAEEALELVGLSEFIDAYPEELSGGMRQRLNIARVLAPKPRVILMDEPFGALDEQTRMVLGEQLLGIQEETGSTIVFVTHSLSEAAILSDRIAVLSSRPGRVGEVVVSDLPRPRTADSVGTSQYNDLTRRLWELLATDARASAMSS